MFHFRPRTRTQDSQELPEVTRAPFVPSRVRNNNQESQVTTQSSSTTSTESKSAEVTTTRARTAVVRNRNLFNTANRRVPLNRFRGRQRVAKPQVEQEQPEEQIEIQLEIEEERKAAEEVEPQVSSTESSLKRPSNNLSFIERLRAQRERRPRPNIRSRPLSASRRPAFALRRRKPVDDSQAEDVQDQGDQALLVCSEGKCFDPTTKKEIKQSKKPKQLSKEVMRLLEEMKILEAEEATDEKKQNHIALLLEAAKVRTKPSRILKTNDLIEMLRSSGALFDDPDSAVAKKEVMETIEVAEEFLEEEMGVEEMIRGEFEEVIKEVAEAVQEVEEEEEEVTTIKAMEELEEPVTTLPDIPEDLESAEGGLSMTLEVVQEEPEAEVRQEIVEPLVVPVDVKPDCDDDEEATDAPMISESVEEEELEELLEEYDDEEEMTTLSPVEEKVVDTFVVQANSDEEEVVEEIEVGVEEMEKAEVRQEVVEPLVVPVDVKPDCDDDEEVVTEQNQEETEEVEQEVEQDQKEVSVKKQGQIGKARLTFSFILGGTIGN